MIYRMFAAGIAVLTIGLLFASMQTLAKSGGRGAARSVSVRGAVQPSAELPIAAHPLPEETTATTRYLCPSHASVGRDDGRSSDTHATLWDAGRITRSQSLRTRLHNCCSIRVSVSVWLSQRIFVRNSLRGTPRRLFGRLLRRRYRQPKSPVTGWRRRLTAFRISSQANGLVVSS